MMYLEYSPMIFKIFSLGPSLHELSLNVLKALYRVRKGKRQREKI